MKKIKILIPLFSAATFFLLALATFLERAYGIQWAHDNIYGAPWFVCWWGLLGAALLFALIRRPLWRSDLPAFLLHLSLLVILSGGLLTFLFGEKGMIHLRQNQTTRSFYLEDGTARELPFALTLRRFSVLYYPGTDAVSDYVSRVRLSDADSDSGLYDISMNHVLRTHGYRFCQTSFDPDRLGTFLSVNYDPWGTSVTYLGYLLFLIAALALLLRRNGTFRSLLRRLGPLSKTLILFSLSLTSLFASLPAGARTSRASLPEGTADSTSQTDSVTASAFLSALTGGRQIVVRAATADSMALCQVLYNQRIAPFSTVATDVLRKVYGRNSFNGLSAEQVVCSLVLYPQSWMSEKLIRIRNRALCDSLRLDGTCASIADLYEPDGTYRLQRWWKPSRRTDPFQKAIAETDEKLSVLTMLRAGTLFSFLAPDHPHRLSPLRLRAEIFYNRHPLPSFLFMLCLPLGLFAFVLCVTAMLRSSSSASRWMLWTRRFLWLLLCLCCLSVALFYALRWYISAHVPLANGYETMLFVSLVILLLGALFGRHSLLLLAASFKMAGFALLVSSLGSMNPQVTSLLPVLSSPWLSAHVSVVMIAYALFAFALFVSLTAVILHLSGRPGLSGRLQPMSQLLIYPAVLLLGVGIFLGSVWAGVSWGSYWSWDAKEVWALLTMMAYAVLLHRGRLTFLYRPFLFHLLVIVFFLVLLMTYFGVNLLFEGMHSYK